MNRSPELLEFYLVEATEYIDALDQLVTGEPHPIDTNALLATARALRGSSNMANVEAVAELSLGLEQVAIRGREPDFAWTPELFEALQGAVNDLRFCVRGVRVWSAREQARAEARAADLRRFYTVESRRPTPPSTESTTPVFLALQAAAIAAELDAFVAAPTNRRALDDAIGRTRTLRGVAGIADYPPLADVAEAVERTARSLMPDAPLATTETALFQSAAGLFREAAEHLRGPGSYAPSESATARFAEALAGLEAPDRSTPPVLRIEQLFYGEPDAPAGDRPPPPRQRPEDRLHRELLARSEHLRRILSEARHATDTVVVARVRRELLATTREVERLAAGAGAHQLSAFFAETAEGPDPLAPRELDALEAACLVTEAPFPSIDELERRISAIQRVPHAPAPSDPPAAPPPSAPSTAHRSLTPTGRELQALLQTGIAGFKSLEAEPLSTPADLGAGEVVSIESLLFRGPAALSRAIELRDAWRTRGTAEDETLREILDLLDLARPE